MMARVQPDSELCWHEDVRADVKTIAFLFLDFVGLSTSRAQRNSLAVLVLERITLSVCRRQGPRSLGCR